MIVSGQVAQDLNFNTGKGLMSPYYKAQSTIPQAMALMVMNISGVRPLLEDGSSKGHENRFGICVAEDTANPWGPLHTDFGIDANDSAVTLTWPASKEGGSLSGNDVGNILDRMLNVKTVGFYHGATWVLDVATAQTLVDAGWSRKDVLGYIVEYCRYAASNVPDNLVPNNHLPKLVQEGKLKLPESPDLSTRVFWDDRHLLIAVCGVSPGYFAGGADHGGPSVTKIDLPANWDKLVKKYQNIVPTYVEY
jgi:hypothetical protein